MTERVGDGVHLKILPFEGTDVVDQVTVEFSAAPLLNAAQFALEPIKLLKSAVKLLPRNPICG